MRMYRYQKQVVWENKFIMFENNSLMFDNIDLMYISNILKENMEIGQNSILYSSMYMLLKEEMPTQW